MVHVVAIAGTTAYVSARGVSIVAIVLLVALGLATGISVTGGYHRLFAHGTYQAHPLVRAFYLFFGAAAVENSALRWCADHRRHHAYTDEELDPYNIKKGFWWAHIAWVFFRDPQELPSPKVADLERDPLVRLQHRFYLPLVVIAGFALPTAIGALFGDPWGGLIIGGFLRLLLIYHTTFCVNSVAHVLGSRPYSDRDSSRDSFVTALITLGEGYHNFHHTFPFDYRNGVRAWQFDPTKWTIRALSWLGLARDLVRTPEDVIVRARLAMDEKRATAWLKEHPVAAARLRAAREHLEKLLDAWTALKARLADLRTRTENRSREAIAALKREIRDAKRRFRDAYRAWRDSLRRPALLLAGA